MANIYRALDITSTQATVTSFKQALLDKYGANNLTFHYENTQNLIFTCPQINEKVIRVYCESVLKIRFYYGDDYSSGTTLTNSESFFYNYNSGTDIHLVLGDAFILINRNASDSNYYSLGVIAKTKAGVSICFGAINGTNTSYTSNVLTRDVTNDKPVTFLSYAKNMYSSENIPYITPLYLIYMDTNVPLKQSDGTFDTIEGLYMSCYIGEFLLRENAIFSFNTLYSNSTLSYIHAYSSIMAEF